LARILDNISGTASDDFKVAVANGKVPGWRALRLPGTCSNVPTGSVPHEMWSHPSIDIRTLPSTPAVAAVVSTSANDTSAGTGARTVRVSGLDEDYLEVSEVVALNGVTPVNTTQTFIRVNSAVCTSAGSGAVNAGGISVSVGGNDQAYITVGKGQSANTGYCIPADYKYIITSYIVGTGRISGSSDCEITGQVKLFQENPVWVGISRLYLYQIILNNSDTVPTIVPPKTDIRQIITSTSTTQAFSIIGGYLVKV